MKSAPIDQFDRLPPHDLDAEVCVIGALCMCRNDPVIFSEIRGMVSSKSFFQADYGIIFGILETMERNGETIDTITLHAKIEKAGLLNEVGGKEAIAKFYDVLPGPVAGPQYAKIVREKFALREMIRISNDCISDCYAPSKDRDRAIAIAGKFSRESGEVQVSGSSETAVSLSDVMLDVSMGPSKDSSPRLMTGLTTFDRDTGGLGMGQFVLVGGRPGMGKSALIKQMALNIAAFGTTVGIISVEETRVKMAQNALSNLSGIENHKIAFWKLDATGAEAVTQAAVASSKMKIFVDDISSTLSGVENSIIRLATKHRCKLIAVDYLQLISAPGAENRNCEVGFISNSLKRLFKRLNVASLVACQLSRPADKRDIKRPTLTDLRDSGSLEQDGDLIVLLHREDYYRQHEPSFVPTNQLEAIVAKHKDNSQCVIPLHFAGKFQRITDWNNGQGVDPNSPQQGALYNPADDLM